MADKSQAEIISKNLALYRKLNGLTQAELADALGYSNKSVSKWERGEGLPDILLLITLSDIYSVSVSELIGQAPRSRETNEKLKAFERDKRAIEKSKKKALERAKKNKKKNKNGKGN